MIQHIWTIPCQVAITNQDTNNLSLIEVLEEITVGGRPANDENEQLVPAAFAVVSLWMRENKDCPEEGRARVEYVDSNGRRLFAQEHGVDLTEARRLRSFFRVLGFAWNAPGTYHFVISRQTSEGQWEQVARVPLEVNVEPADPPALEAP